MNGFAQRTACSIYEFNGWFLVLGVLLSTLTCKKDSNITFAGADFSCIHCTLVKCETSKRSALCSDESHSKCNKRILYLV